MSEDKLELVTLLGSFGDDLMVANCARVSMKKRHILFDPVGDTRLIKYLAKHKHWSPFAHPHIQLRIEAPIFVARQWFRHTVGTIRSEVSRRYVDDEPSCYTPKSWRSRPEKNIKQGSGGELDENAQDSAHKIAMGAHIEAATAYYELLELGVSPEMARMVLPQSMMTQWVETGSLYYWANFCRQRLDSHAQAEIRGYAEEVSEIANKLFPVSWKTLMDVNHE